MHPGSQAACPGTEETGATCCHGYQEAGSCRLHLAYRAGFAVDLVDVLPSISLRVRRICSVLQFYSKFPKSFPLHADSPPGTVNSYKCIGLLCPDLIPGASAAQDQLHRTKKDRLTAPDLTCEDIQPRTKFYFISSISARFLHMKMY